MIGHLGPARAQIEPRAPSIATARHPGTGSRRPPGHRTRTEPPGAHRPGRTALTLAERARPPDCTVRKGPGLRAGTPEAYGPGQAKSLRRAQRRRDAGQEPKDLRSAPLKRTDLTLDAQSRPGSQDKSPYKHPFFFSPPTPPIVAWTGDAGEWGIAGSGEMPREPWSAAAGPDRRGAGRPGSAPTWNRSRSGLCPT